MQENIIIIVGLAILSFVSGMLGLGVVFSAISFLGLFTKDLDHEVQPLNLPLNGLCLAVRKIKKWKKPPVNKVF